jgi:flagellar biosynthesis/type III secretory pathway protein FliH
MELEERLEMVEKALIEGPLRGLEEAKRQGFTEVDEDIIAKELGVSLEEARRFLGVLLGAREAKVGNFVFEAVSPMLLRDEETDKYVLLEVEKSYIEGKKRITWMVYSKDLLRHEFNTFKEVERYYL